MMIDSQLLEQWYCRERVKLESMSCFEREAKFKLLKIKEIILDALDKEMNADNLEGKYNDLHLLKLFESYIDKNKTNEILKNNVSEDKKRVAEDMESTYLPTGEKDGAKALENQSHDVYAHFLYQLEKINKIEEEIRKRGIDPEKVYKEYRGCC